jgi:hypothetical protein
MKKARIAPGFFVHGGIQALLRFGEFQFRFLRPAEQQEGSAEDLGHIGAAGRGQFFGSFVTVQEAAFQDLDLDQFMVLESLIGLSDKGLADLALADGDDRSKGMSQAPEVSFLFAG